MGTKRKQVRHEEPVLSDGVTDWKNLCPHDGSPLDTRGYCTKADGFPLMRWFWHQDAHHGKGAWEAQGWACPFACLHCGHVLEWDGCCLSCGPKAGAPGNRYGIEEFTIEIRGKTKKVKGNHWVYNCGPEKPMTQEQHVALLVKLKTLTASLA